MELIERTNLNKISYLNSLTDKQLGQYYNCKDKTELKTSIAILRQYLKTNIKDRCQTTRIYSYSLQTPLGSGGRLYSGNSLQGLPSKIRGFLFSDNTTDIDMKNAHPTILSYICTVNKLSCPFLNDYNLKRDYIINNFDGYSKDEAKTLFLCAINDSKTKRLKNGVKNEFFKNFDKEMKRLQIEIPALPVYADISSSVPASKIINWNGSALNRIMCMYENQILHQALSVLNHANIEICALMFDGIMPYGHHYENEELLHCITASVNKKFEGLNMQWSYKSHNQDIVMDDEWVAEQIISSNTFDNVRQIFEKTHCKITNKSFFVKEFDDNIIIMSRQAMCTSYEHMCYDKMIDNEIKIIPNFIGDWFKYPQQRNYDDIGIFPDATLCPSNHFNAWKPFAMEFVTEYVDNPVSVKFFKKHILILCDNDPVVADYFEKWLAQMIQFPAVKSICPVLISKEGAGKGSLIQLIEKMIGSSKMFETSTPARDVWGDFNGTMATSFFVVLNELSKKDTIESEGKIKALVTDPTMTINNKGISQYKINSFHRFLITTNNLDPVKSTTDDRRKMIVRSSDELIGNKAYFNKFYELVGDINAVKSFYEYLKGIEGMGDFGKIPMPVTEFQENVKESYVTCEEQWIKYFVSVSDDDEISIFSKDCFTLFKNWLIDNGLKDYNTNVIKFSLKIANMKLNGLQKKHTKTGTANVFDIPVLKKTLGF